MDETGISKELETYKTQGANLLMPSTSIAGLSEWHAPVVEKVTLSANPDDGDVYPHDNKEEEDQKKKKFRLTKQALMKLSVCAGVIWSVEQSHRLDDGSNRDYVAYRAVGGLRKADGQPIFFSAEYDMDFEIIEEELRELYEGKARRFKKEDSAAKKAEYVDFCVKRDLLQKRKHKVKLCEAGAMNRVIRELLGLKNAYTAGELAKPFVMARIVFKPDFSDKEVRAKLIDASIKSMMGIYGPQALERGIKEAEPIDITPIPESGNGDNPEKDDWPDAEELANTYPPAGVFEGLGYEEQEGLIKKLVDQKKYDLPDYLRKSNHKGLKEMSNAKFNSLYAHLLTLPDPAAIIDDDIPF
jgi:hypothetical protein